MTKQQPIMEAASENKRGRPRVFPDSIMQIARYIKPERSPREQMNTAYALKALRILNDADFNNPETDKDGIRGWLHPLDEELRSGNARLKWSLLAELGRMSGHDIAVILDVADYACVMHHVFGSTVKNCIKMVHNARTDPDFLQGVIDYMTAEA